MKTCKYCGYKIQYGDICGSCCTKKRIIKNWKFKYCKDRRDADDDTGKESYLE